MRGFGLDGVHLACVDGFSLSRNVADGKMRAVSEQTSTVDSVRLAVLAALNIADEYHLLKRKVETPKSELKERAHQLASALDEVLQDNRRTG